MAQKYPFKGKGIYRIIGKVVEEFDFLSVEVSQLQRMAYVPDPRFDPTYDRKESSVLQQQTLLSVKVVVSLLKIQVRFKNLI